MTSTQHSFQSPKPTHRLHPFTRQDRLFIVDLDVGQVLEADDLIWEILQLCPESTPGEILEALSEKYEPERIYQAFEQLHNFEEMGLLFGNTGQETLEKKNRLRIFVAGPIETWTSDKTYVRSGYRLASKEILSALSRYADLFFHAAKSEVISDGVYTLSGGTSRHNFLFQLQQNQIDGIFIPMIPLDMVEQMPLHLFSSGVPVISRLGSPRGHNGSMINSILWTYAAMNEHDAFITPTRSIKDFYAQHVLDTDCFHVIPNGVDSDLFRPMDKAQARSQVAEMLNRPEIRNQKIVGFFGRFQPEKGAGIFIKIAKMLPEVLFFVVAPTLHAYQLQKLPPNLIYIGEQPPREMLPLYLNTFDVHCFPSIVGEEAFGNAVLETMACGVPPVVTNFAGLPEVVGDAGRVVACQTFNQDIGSFAGYVEPEVLSKAIQELLNDDVHRMELSKQARERSLEFKWDTTAKKLVLLYESLKRKKQFSSRTRFKTSFVPSYGFLDDQLQCQSILTNVTEQHNQEPLMHSSYHQDWKAALALTLLERHTVHEVEVVLMHIVKDRHSVADILNRVNGFTQATSL
ncbi:glycosyltransferase [Candidatus Poribacteria bacterium]|nr:glycosyltransferase [Candidatus Poribacteria bacterium]